MPNPARIESTVRQLSDSAPDGPMSVQQARAAGVTEGQLRAAVRRGAVLMLRRGIVMPSARWLDADPVTRHRWALRAALLAYPGSWASHDSAARLLDLPEFGLDPIDIGDVGAPPVHITRTGAGRRDDWLRVHGGDASGGFVTTTNGIPGTDVIRTSIELGSTRSLRRAVAFIDAGMRIAVAERCSPSQVRTLALDPDTRHRLRNTWMRALSPYTGHRWVTRVRTAIDWADPAAESVLESVSRAEIFQSPLPRPRCGIPVRGDDGQVYFGDFVWDSFGVIGEADGLGKYADAIDLVREKRRQEALEAAGWVVVRWGWEEAVVRPELMLGRVGRALDQPRRLRAS